MEPDAIFLRRCSQIVTLLSAKDKESILDLALPLRQLLIDKHTILGAANKNKIKIVFIVGKPKMHKIPKGVRSIWSIIDALDPNTFGPQLPRMELNLNQFIKFVVMHYNDRDVTIRDIIKNAAEIEGGVHYDPREVKRNEPAGMMQKTISVWGIPIGIYSLRAIASVTIRALQPVIEDVQKRQSTAHTEKPAPSPDKPIQPKS